MTMDPTQPFALAPPLRVDPAAIERGLAQLWQSADQAPAIGAASSVVRSCTLNFAVVLSGDDHAAQISDAVASITLRHPCRIFLLLVRSQGAAAVDAAVSALCHLPSPGQPHICCEQISIEAGGSAVRGLPHLLLALMVPDLPLVVWWRGRPPLDAPLFTELSAIADRVVIDSASLDTAQLAQIAARLDGDRTPALADLAWSRLTPWRGLTAQCFDTPRQQEWLGRVDRVRVEVGGVAVTSQPLLWLGWVASRLGWTLTSGESGRDRCRYTFDAGRTVQAEIGCTGDGEPGELCAVELSVGGMQPARFAATQCAGYAVRASLERQDIAPRERVVPLAGRDVAALLSDELDLVGRDLIYESALRMASRLAPPPSP